MTIKSFIPAALLFGSILSSCSIGNSLESDASSSNPAVAQQAQKVQELQRQVHDQEAISDAEKKKLEGLKQQLEGARQNLKGVKTLAKSS